MSHTETDEEIALRLHHEMNGAISIDLTEESVMSRIGRRENIISISDSSPETCPENHIARKVHPKTEAGCLGIKQNCTSVGQVSFQNQQAITIKQEKTSGNDYYMPSIPTYIDLNNNQEWAVVNMDANIQQMFDKLKNHLWQQWLPSVQFVVKWDKTEIISDESVFKIFENDRQVLISTSAMTRPRIQLVSILLHVLIHIYINVSSKGSIRTNIHDENFRAIMLFLNGKLNTQITTFHKFPYSPDEVDYPGQWYQCTGICQSYEPFHGTVRCSAIPNESHTFWHDHDESCGGQFFKIFEMSRTNPETFHQEKKYVRNVRYMFPKSHNVKHHLKTKNPVRELYDLTDDTEEAVKVQNLCDIINLDDTDYNLPSPVTSRSTQDFAIQNPSIFELCPFCETVVGSSRFSSHVDSCRGYQQKVLFNAASAVKIVTLKGTPLKFPKKA